VSGTLKQLRAVYGQFYGTNGEKNPRYARRKRYTRRVQKYTRFVIVIIICFLLIAASAGTAFASSSPTSWLNNIFTSGPFSFFNKNEKSEKAHSKQLVYAALGDSVAAGSGLPFVGNASPTDKTCARSKQGYPAIIASQLHAKLIFAACGGATTTDTIVGQSLGTTKTTPQLNSAFKSGTPDVITITLGANDTKWIPVIGQCYTDVCGSESDTASIDARLAAYRSNLRKMLTDIAQRSSGKHPEVILTGYYSFGSPDCLASIAPDNISVDEVRWFDEQTQKLADTTIATAQQFPNTKYASMDATNHGLCASSANRWVQNLGDPAPFHLTAAGEKALAKAVSAKITVKQ
jgi:lysophospholipase L1-like esterase